MARQCPRGPEDLDCPQWQKPMSEVCHKCPLWTFVRMEDPRTGDTLDKWDCAIAWGPILQVDLLKRMDRTTASVDKVANVLDEGLPARSQARADCVNLSAPTSGVRQIGADRG